MRSAWYPRKLSEDEREAIKRAYHSEDSHAIMPQSSAFTGKAIRDDLLTMTASAFALLEDSLVLYLQNYPNKDTSTWIEDACRKFFRGIV